MIASIVIFVFIGILTFLGIRNNLGMLCSNVLCAKSFKNINRYSDMLGHQINTIKEDTIEEDISKIDVTYKYFNNFYSNQMSILEFFNPIHFNKWTVKQWYLYYRNKEWDRIKKLKEDDGNV